MWEMSDSECNSDEDEDYIPDEESDDGEDICTIESEISTLKNEKRSSKTKKVTTKRKRKGGIKLSSDEEVENEGQEEKSTSSSESSDKETDVPAKSNREQTVLDKAKQEALWTAFKSDVHTSTQQPLSFSKGQKGGEFPAKKSEQTVTITKTFDFAGEEVRVAKTVAADSSEAKKEQTKCENTKASRAVTSGAVAAAPVNRPKRLAGGGLGSVLGQIGKRAKISTLEKSRLDWENFKSNEGIAEDLKHHNKDGFLAKQDFLQRTDEIQFEAERRMREATRKR